MQSHDLPTQVYLDTVVSLIEAGNTQVAVPVSGTSMLPFLRPGDTVYVSPVTAPLKVGDVLLYQRSNGQYILHRLVGFGAQGVLLMMGDNQLKKEPLSPTRVRAIATAIRREDKTETPKTLRWQFYSRIWRSTLLRRVAARFHCHSAVNA